MAVGTFAHMLPLLFVVGINIALGPVSSAGYQKQVLPKVNYSAGAPRKLLDFNDDDDSTNRIGQGTCSKDNILVFQGPTASLPNGIPTYTVEIQNVCSFGSCSISNIHLSCGWFSSARTINPSIFKRVNYDDCVANDGGPLNPGESLTFEYANTYEYPISVSSVSCDP